MLGYLRRSPRDDFLNWGGRKGILEGGRHCDGDLFEIVKLELA